jgi:hypothetical protein
MTRIVKGTITFEYNLDDEEIFNDSNTDEEKIDYFREIMVEDIQAMSFEWPTLQNVIEMEVVNV